MKHDIFVSYSTKDKVIADALVSALENQNFRCWYAPRDVEPGEDWGSAITKAINECQVVLLIFSHNSNQSKRVLDEIYYAISEEKTIIPFRIENLDPTGAMRLHLSSRHWLDAYQPSWQAHINRLIQSVAANMGREVSLPMEEGIPTPDYSQQQLKPRKFPWLWVGLAVIVLAALGVAGAFWLGGRDTGTGTLPTALAAEVQPTITQMPVITAEITPTTQPSSIPTEMSTATETSVQAVPEVVLNGFLVVPGNGISLDPQTWVNTDSTTFAENLFMSLTNYDIEKREVVPEAAESWTVSPDGRIYTFKLRTDIPWVIHTPGGETIQAEDENGVPRFVNAHDFVNAVRRMCDPRIQTENMEFPLLGLIDGCEEAKSYEDVDNFPSELLEGLGVRAITDNELLIELVQPSGYFLSLTTMQSLSAAPQWAIDKYGPAWTNPGNLPTCGRFVLDEWVPGERIRWVRNPLLPRDLAGSGNIDTIEFSLLEDKEDSYPLWLENQLDYSAIPQDDLFNHRVLYARETSQIFEQAVDYFVFTNLNDPPFDNIDLRRAFAAAFDRTAYINDVLEGQGLPMKHLAPPVVFGAPAIDAVGVGYDLEYARNELAASGYPNCQGLQEVTLWLSPSRNKPEVAAIIRDWVLNLGCPEGTIQLTTDLDSGPDMMFVGWLSDYADEHDWVGTILSCNRESVGNRECNEMDVLISQAAQEVVASKRIDLYAQIEEGFFGEQGEFPIIPVRWGAYYAANHTWLDRTQPVMGRETYYDWNINMEAKLKAKDSE